MSRKEGMYGVSRKISPLQRLFTGRVLRDFDLLQILPWADNLMESGQQNMRYALTEEKVRCCWGRDIRI